MPDQRPAADEHAPHHLKYIDLCPTPIIDGLRSQRDEVDRLLRGIAEENAAFRYAPEKWSIRQVAGHLSDAERIYNYRALSLARHDPTPLPPFDPDGYVEEAGFDARTMNSLADEFLAVRDNTISLFENLPAEAWSRRGTMGGQPLSVRALAYIAYGHVAQHVNVMRERYNVT